MNQKEKPLKQNKEKKRKDIKKDDLFIFNSSFNKKPKKYFVRFLSSKIIKFSIPKNEKKTYEGIKKLFF